MTSVDLAALSSDFVSLRSSLVLPDMYLRTDDEAPSNYRAELPRRQQETRTQQRPVG